MATETESDRDREAEERKEKEGCSNACWVYIVLPDYSPISMCQKQGILMCG